MLDSDIKTYHAQEVSKAGTNGGRCGTTEVISGVVNNVWPNVPKAERIAGAWLYRKLFTAVDDATNGTLMTAQQLIDRPTLGGDIITAFVGTPTDQQQDIVGADTGSDTERKYGSAYIKNNIAIGAQTITVTVEDAKFASGAEAIFQAADKIQLKNKPTPDALTGTSEDLTIDAITSVVGLDVTFTTLELIANAYTAGDGNSRCVTLIAYGNPQTSTDNYVVTTVGTGDFNFAAYPLVCDNIGTVEDSLTFDFTDATNFTCTGISGINYGSGNITTDFAPVNPDKSGKIYFKMEFLGFSGVFAAGDTITCDIHESKYSTWYRREVPVDCPSLAGNLLTTVTVGESDS